MPASLTIEDLWQTRKFSPNDNQRDAILYTDGPLYLPAGPGSGKTRVLLWRTVNLIVFHGILPSEIFLSTFTEKAAHQLREGLRQYLGEVSNHTGVAYDISNMYVGTIHSLCQRITADRRFYRLGHRPNAPSLMDALQQYFFLYASFRWNALTAAAGFGPEAIQTINQYFGQNSQSRHNAVVNCIALFNRFSEEHLDPVAPRTRTADPFLDKLLVMYEEYLRLLAPPDSPRLTDFSLLQQNAVTLLESNPASAHVFKHIIIDEYQDTNTIQEQLFFRLAAGTKNLCVVGDDDQALYRFRGATVENFVQFPERCLQHLGVAPLEIPLDINYRSRKKIVEFYNSFIQFADWQVPDKNNAFYRVSTKEIKPHSRDNGPSVVATTPSKPEAADAEIAELVRELIDSGKVSNPNQIAFLYPSLKYNGKMTDQVARMKTALEAVGLEVYAPRAGRFLDVDEAVAVVGVFLQILGKPAKGAFNSAGFNAFHTWLDTCDTRGEEIVRADPRLAHYIADLKIQIAQSVSDYATLQNVLGREHLDPSTPYEPKRHKRTLYNAPGLSETAKKSIGSSFFERFLEKHVEQSGKPFSLQYMLNRATAVDWTMLDLYYRICAFQPFKGWFDDAETKGDEGPMSNLALISQYLSQFNDQGVNVITGRILSEDRLQRRFFSMYLYALYRLGESEFEDADDPFPKGRIPFLTIHQSKGLEFPVVVLGNARKNDKEPPRMEEIIAPLIDRQSEPLDRMAEFDVMRMFYVALSRAQNLLVIAHFRGPGQRVNEPFQELLDDHLSRLPDFDTNSVPVSTLKTADLPQNYSYTGDYLLYLKCPRQYMVFRKFDFVPSRSQTMFFGSLVHRTLEDLHQYLIGQRTSA